MPTIEKLVLHNFKKFDALELNFNNQLNVVVGDNEAGKSSILLALDLVFSGSRSKLETIGLETLFNKGSVDYFLAGEKKPERLPLMYIEVFLSAGINPDLNGKNNSLGIECDGLRLECVPDDALGKEIIDALADAQHNFPFEYYAFNFITFAGQAYSAYKRPVRHLLIDSSRIDGDYAAKEYTRSVFESNVIARDRSKLENLYRRNKAQFRDEHLVDVNQRLTDYKFSVLTNSKTNLESDLVITEGDIPIDSKGKGRQCFIKTEFALNRGGAQPLDALLLEEPENHLSHSSTRKLIDRMAAPNDKQLFIATHSSLICSRLDLRRALLIGSESKPVVLKALPEDTANFFMKAPDNNILEFVLSKRVLLVEGNAEFILLDALYKQHAGGSTLDRDGVHVISVGGTSFKRYLDLAKLLGTRTAVVRDNDGDHQRNCVDNYANYAQPHLRVFSDTDPKRSTFEICIYQDNQAFCEELFGAGRRTLSAQEYMLKNKADAAFELLQEKGDKLVAPGYIKDAIAWIRA